MTRYSHIYRSESSERQHYTAPWGALRSEAKPKNQFAPKGKKKKRRKKGRPKNAKKGHQGAATPSKTAWRRWRRGGVEEEEEGDSSHVGQGPSLASSAIKPEKPNAASISFCVVDLAEVVPGSSYARYAFSKATSSERSAFFGGIVVGVGVGAVAVDDGIEKNRDTIEENIAGSYAL
ncbi:unnamed protein product [Fusarium graminearum]|nr:unnamed protein product [Fusarium graminearum]CAG1988596.1 unnamed protein product [Fusarium graminearum]CZS72465.1 unnamed protein product [Fusarium graminearum]